MYVVVLLVTLAAGAPNDREDRDPWEHDTESGDFAPPCLLQTFLGARQAVSVDGDSWSKHAAGVQLYNGTYGCVELPGNYDGREGLGGTAAEPRRLPAPRLVETGADWPNLRRGVAHLPLRNPQAYVISMSHAAPRRAHFGDQWNSLNLDVPARWARAFDGTENIDEAAGWKNSAIYACWKSHASIFAHHQEGDLVIFEDDVLFHPDFTRRLHELMINVPSDWDVVHLGGDAFWDPPYGRAPQYFWVRSASRTWGYIVREAAVKRISAVLNAQGSPDALRPLPIDATLAALSSACEGGTALRTYAPRVPLLQQARAASSQTGHPDPSFDYATEDDFYDRELKAVSWQESESLQWAPTFCGQTAEDQEKFWPKIRESGWSDFCCAHFIPPPIFCKVV
jgi:hypothetical protein